MPRNLRFLHTADIHLHAPLKYLNRNYPVRQQDFRQTLLRMKTIIAEKKIPFWLIAGDLWEHERVTPPTLHFLQHLFAEIPDTRIFISPGNHDPFMPDSYYRTASWPGNVKIFSGEWEAVPLPEWDLCIYGIGFRDPCEKENPLHRFPGKEPGFSRHILVMHGSVLEWIEDSGSSPYAPFALDELAGLGVDYAALGHIHKMKIFRNQQGEIVAAYPGSPESIRAQETGERYCLLGEWEDGGLSLAPIPVQSRLFRAVEVDLTGSSHYEEVRERILRAISRLPKEEMLQIRLQGEISRYLDLSKDMLDALVMDRFYVQWVDETRPDYDLEQLKKEDTLLSLFLRRTEEKIKGERDEQKREELLKAQSLILDCFLRKEVNL